MWPYLEGAVRVSFSAVKLRAAVEVGVPMSEKTKEAVAVLSAVAETKKSVGEAAEEAVDGLAGKSG